jgi:glycosyltransferase involved in cell wall biosynthesis
VSDDELIALYSQCTLFVFPSFHEGFGLPALEAMCCGAAVIGSNTSSIPEVIGKEDALFDPCSD